MRAKSTKFFAVIFIASVVSCFFSCGNKSSEFTPQTFVAFVENKDNGFFKEKQMGNLLYKIKYEPVAYQAARKVINGEIKDRNQWNSFMKERGGLNYFVIEIENARSESDVLMEEVQGNEMYLQRVNYFSYDFERDISFVPGNDTLPCALFHYENSYGGTPKLKFLVAFQNKEGDKGRTVVINDRVFNNGNIKFEMNETQEEENLVLNF
ncbi:MAG: hypothetical protein IAF38_19865 [Bacteroidia bacterium]|nr:hypothetical protein [Bacteroidia bacterium]